MTDEQLTAIRARCEAAMPGPWDNTNRTYGYPCKTVGYNHPTGLHPTIANCSHADAETATFIAHAREDIPALLAEIEHLRGLLSSRAAA